jgi:hypothetical protein
VTAVAHPPQVIPETNSAIALALSDGVSPYWKVKPLPAKFVRATQSSLISEVPDPRSGVSCGQGPEQCAQVRRNLPGDVGRTDKQRGILQPLNRPERLGLRLANVKLATFQHSPGWEARPFAALAAPPQFRSRCLHSVRRQIEKSLLPDRDITHQSIGWGALG